MDGTQMAKIVFKDFDDFINFIPALIGVGLNNFDPDEASGEFFDNIQLKMKTQIKKFIRENPDMRRKLKLFLQSLESGVNSTITVKGGKTAITTESKYLTEGDFQPMEEIIEKYTE